MINDTATSLNRQGSPDLFAIFAKDLPRLDGAACKNSIDPDAWHSQNKGTRRWATEHCSVCPAAAQCLEWAVNNPSLADPEREGRFNRKGPGPIYGGHDYRTYMTEMRRRQEAAHLNQTVSMKKAEADADAEAAWDQQLADLPELDQTA